LPDALSPSWMPFTILSISSALRWPAKSLIARCLTIYLSSIMNVLRKHVPDSLPLLISTP
jgi:hypothetical protein